MKQVPGDQVVKKNVIVKTMPRVTSRPVYVNVWLDGKESCVDIVSTSSPGLVQTSTMLVDMSTSTWIEKAWLPC